MKHEFYYATYEATVNAIILLSVPIVFLAGAGYAVWMRHRPNAYAQIATTNVDAEELEAVDASSERA